MMSSSNSSSKRILMKTKPIFTVGMLLLFFGSVGTLQGQTITLKQPQPEVLVVNTLTPVTISATIVGDVLPGGVNLLRIGANGSSTVLGQLSPNTTAGVNGYSITRSFTEATLGTVTLQLSVASRGQLRRVASQTFLLAVNSVAITLPPDPGEAGKLTLAGVDSDNDGIRDDVFRNIIFASLGSDLKRESMKQLARAVQPYLLTTTSLDAKTAVNPLTEAVGCLYALNGLAAADIVTLEQSFILNTEQRLLAYFNAQRLMGTTFGRATDVSSCSFNVPVSGRPTIAANSPLVATSIDKESCKEGTHSTTIFFINGIWTVEESAIKNAEALKELLTALPASVSQNICVSYVHNWHESLIGDLIQTIKQSKAPDLSFVSFYLNNGIESAPPELKYHAVSTAAVIKSQDIVTAENLAEHIARYRFEIKEKNRKVILVPHSQGNFFANEAYKWLLENDGSSVANKINVIGIATPDSKLGWQPATARYTTLCEDFIWKADLTPKPLLWNIYNNLAYCLANELPLNDLLRLLRFLTDAAIKHSFVENYLAPNSGSRTQILGDIKNAITSTAGTITVNATLDGNPWPSTGTGALQYTIAPVIAGSIPNITGTAVPAAPTSAPLETTS